MIGLEKSFCRRFYYPLYDISKHLSEAEPSAHLREALLNTCYITALTKLETFPVDYSESGGVFDLLANFLFFLKGSVSIHCLYSEFHQSYPIHCLQKFTDTEDLYLHHRNIYDRIMRKRIADFSLDFGSIVGLAFIGLLPDIPIYNEYFTDYFPAVKGGLLPIYHTLYFRQGCRRDLFADSRYQMLLTEFLTDPGRAGEHALDGPKCSLVAIFMLDCFIPPCSARNFFR